MTSAAPYPITLAGNIVIDEVGTIAHGFLTFETGRGKHGRITDITLGSEKPGGAAPVYWLHPTQVIFPGLINLHNHVAWNFIPLWHADEREAPVFDYDNRFEWQAKDSTGYVRNVTALEALIQQYFKAHPLPGPIQSEIQLSAFSEVQAACGGTTVIQESRAFDASLINRNHILIRSTGNANDMEIDGQYIDSAVKFYEPQPPASEKHPQDTSGWSVAAVSALGEWAHDLQLDRVYSALVHLSEGRFGFLGRGTKDAYTRNEWLTFKRLVEDGSPSHPSFPKPAPAAFADTRFNMIHACGIDPDDPSDIAFLKDYGLSVLWSPVSNTMLYADTIPITRLIEKGVNCVLTSDWAPSGSKHVWDESKHAEIFLTKRMGMARDDARRLLYKMMTVNPAKALGREQQIGTIRKKGWADLFILSHTENVDPQRDNAIDILFAGEDARTAGVYTGGMLVLADRNTFCPPGFSADFEPLPASDGSGASSKSVNFKADGDFPRIDITKIAAEVDRAFAQGGTVQIGGRPVTVPGGAYQRSKLLVSDDMDYRAYMARLDTWLAN